MLPECYTARCTCDFANSSGTCVPHGVMKRRFIPRTMAWWIGGLQDGDDERDFAVHGTHVGLVFNPSVYRIIAERLVRMTR